MAHIESLTAHCTSDSIILFKSCEHMLPQITEILFPSLRLIPSRPDRKDVHRHETRHRDNSVCRHTLSRWVNVLVMLIHLPAREKENLQVYGT